MVFSLTFFGLILLFIFYDFTTLRNSIEFMCVQHGSIRLWHMTHTISMIYQVVMLQNSINLQCMLYICRLNVCVCAYFSSLSLFCLQELT